MSRGYYELTLTLPDGTKLNESYNDLTEMTKRIVACPVKTEIWVMIPTMKIGYGLDVVAEGVAL
jgi:hypothetical protein